MSITPTLAPTMPAVFRPFRAAATRHPILNTSLSPSQPLRARPDETACGGQSAVTVRGERARAKGSLPWGCAVRLASM